MPQISNHYPKEKAFLCHVNQMITGPWKSFLSDAYDNYEYTFQNSKKGLDCGLIHQSLKTKLFVLKKSIESQYFVAFEEIKSQSPEDHKCILKRVFVLRTFKNPKIIVSETAFFKKIVLIFSRQVDRSVWENIHTSF